MFVDNAHALVIGIADYQYVNPLPSAVTKDAMDIYSLLIDPQYCNYSKNNVQLLLNDQATQISIRQALTDLAQHCNQDSTVFLYISSHGGQIESGEYLLPVDTINDSDETLAQTALSGTEFTDLLRNIPARKVVVIFDCCHSGGIGQPKVISPSLFKTGLSEKYYEVLQTGRGRVILASSLSREYSYIQPGATNSLFTQHLLAGLRGGAPGPGGVIRIFDLFHYVQPRVTAEQPKQHPLFKAEIEENFPITLYPENKAPTPLPSTPPSEGFVYDVFISYSEQEPVKTWVRKTLFPALAAQRLRCCIDYRDFRPGFLRLKEMERAVEQSRYTLTILSPGYLQSNFAELENILAEHLGLERSERRRMDVMREVCTPRLGMRARLWLDMTDDDEFDINVARLIYEIKQPPSL